MSLFWRREDSSMGHLFKYRLSINKSSLHPKPLRLDSLKTQGIVGCAGYFFGELFRVLSMQPPVHSAQLLASGFPEEGPVLFAGSLNRGHKQERRCDQIFRVLG